jgi:ABC-type transport system involved in cytochrome bd biosynthesis fused ATPase/permease subunit
MQSIAQELIQRKSPRLKEKNREGKIITKLAQDLIAKKCGIISEEGNLEDLTLQQYLDLYKKPLSEPEMEAIMELTKVAKEMKKKRLHKKYQKDHKGNKEKIISVNETSKKNRTKGDKVKRSKKHKMTPEGASA